MSSDNPVSLNDQAESWVAVDSVQADSTKTLSGYELVADMMRRQDEVISQIDALNDRIESVIKELSEARKLEQAAEEEAAIPQKEAGRVSTEDTADQSLPRKAA